MKQIIIFVIAVLATYTSFASLKPVKLAISAEIKLIVKNRNTLKVSLKHSGKVNIGWIAGIESTSTVYTIQKSINGSSFKTIAILMGETNDSYFFRDTIKDFTGDIQYRVVAVDNNTVIKTLTQYILVF